MRRKLDVSASVKAALIGVQTSFLRDVGSRDANDGRLVGVFDMERANLAATLNEGHDSPLACGAGTATFSERTAFTLRRYLFFLGRAEVGFISLNDAASAAHGSQAAVAHCLTDAMGNEPRSFESAAKGAVKLVGANALL